MTRIVLNGLLAAALAIGSAGLPAEAATTRRLTSATLTHPKGGLAMSSTGRYVAFIATSSTDNVPHVYVHDTTRRTTEQVDVTPAGRPGGGEARMVSISGDGRYIAFTSLAADLISGDTNGTQDAFVRDRVARRTRRVSLDAKGRQIGSVHGTMAIGISANGVYAFFQVDADLLGVSTPGASPLHLLYRRHLRTGKLEVVSIGPDGKAVQAEDYGSTYPVRGISSDGRHVAFGVLVSRDPYVEAVYVRDLARRRTVSVSPAPLAGESRYTHVVMDAAGEWVAFAVNSSLGPSSRGYYARNLRTGVVRDLTDTASARRVVGADASFGAPAISGNGKYLFYAAPATGSSAANPLGYVVTQYALASGTGQTRLAPVSPEKCAFVPGDPTNQANLNATTAALVAADCNQVAYLATTHDGAGVAALTTAPFDGSDTNGAADVYVNG